MGFLGKDQGIGFKYNPADVWERLLRTYADADLQHTRDALFTMTDLFESFAA